MCAPPPLPPLMALLPDMELNHIYMRLVLHLVPIRNIIFLLMLWTLPILGVVRDIYDICLTLNTLGKDPQDYL